MYTRQEAAKLKEAFWTALGQYLAPVPGAEGERVHWLNYRTGEKGLQFKMEGDNRSARVFIELSHKDPELQELYLIVLQKWKALLEEIMGEAWTWGRPLEEEGRTLTRIQKSLEGVSVLKQEDWPALISFFKPRIIGLDRFWSEVKYAFEALR